MVKVTVTVTIPDAKKVTPEKRQEIGMALMVLFATRFTHEIGACTTHFEEL